jgi:hypothetical protein
MLGIAAAAAAAIIVTLSAQPADVIPPAAPRMATLSGSLSAERAPPVSPANVEPGTAPALRGLDVVLGQLPARTLLAPWPRVRVEPAGVVIEPLPGVVCADRELDGLRTRVPLEPGSWQVSLSTLGEPVGQKTAAVEEGEAAVVFDAREFAGFVGRVVDEAGQPLAGARASLQRHGQELEEGSAFVSTAAADGTYVLPFLRADRAWTIRWSAEGRQARTQGPLLPGGRALCNLPDVVLERARTVEGSVIDDAGAPVASCPVHVQVEDGTVASGRSQADGSFAFTGLPLGEASVWTSLRESRLANTVVHVKEEGDADVSVVLQAGVWIEGSTLGASGQAVPDVRVWGFPVAAASGAAAIDLDPGSTESDGNGSFRLGPFPPGCVRLTAPFDGGVEQLVAAPSRVTLVVAGPREWKVPVSFVQPDGSPVDVRGGTYAFSWGSGSGRATKRNLAVTLDRSGEWLFQRSTPEGQQVSLEFAFAGHELARVPDLAAALDETGSLRVELLRASACTIRVADATGEPIAGAVVSLEFGVLPDVATALQRRSAGSRNSYSVTSHSAPGHAQVETRLTTGRDGLVGFDSVPAGTVTWLVTATGHLPRTGQFERRGQCCAEPCADDFEVLLDVVP